MNINDFKQTQKYVYHFMHVTVLYFGISYETFAFDVEHVNVIIIE